MTANLALDSYLDWLAQEETARQEAVRTYRAYYAGDHPTTLTERMAAFLNIDRDKGLGVNCTAVIVDAVKERLEVTGFDVKPIQDNPAPPLPPSNGNGSKPAVSEPVSEDVVSRFLSAWWQQNRMDAVQDWVYQAALRDSEAYIIVGYDGIEGRPTLSHDFAYDGTSGVKVHTVPGTYNQLALASKRWVIDQGEKAGKLRRLNLYYPGRIEKWQNRNEGPRNEAFWTPYLDPDDPTLQLVNITADGRTYEAAVSWWTNNGTETGQPLGIPVIPFRNRDDGTGVGMSEIDNSIPLQDGINKLFIDLLAAADMSGFGMYWTNGKGPSGGFKVYPGAILPIVPADGVDNSSAQIGALPAGDLTQLIGGINTVVGLLAGITGTPQSRFTPSIVRPSADTQKQEEGPLVSKVQGLQKLWGNSWEDVMSMALKVERAFGSESVPETKGLLISTQWKPAEIRNEKQHIETIAMKVEKLKIPEEQAWREAGYTEEQIQEFTAIREETLSKMAALTANLPPAQPEQPSEQQDNAQEPAPSGQREAVAA